MFTFLIITSLKFLGFISSLMPVKLAVALLGFYGSIIKATGLIVAAIINQFPTIMRWLKG